MNTDHGPPPSGQPDGGQRLYTIAEAAAAAGVSKKAMRSRVDRSQANPEAASSLRVVMRNGERHVPRAELVRVGLLTEGGAPAAPTRPAPSTGTEAGAPTAPPAQVVVDVDAMLARVERLAGDLRERLLLESQAGEREREERRARHALEEQLHQARAQLRQAELRAEAAEARLAEQAGEREEPPNGTGGGGGHPTGAEVTRTSSRSGLWSWLTRTGGSTLLLEPARS